MLVNDLISDFHIKTTCSAAHGLLPMMIKIRLVRYVSFFFLLHPSQVLHTFVDVVAFSIAYFNWLLISHFYTPLLFSSKRLSPSLYLTPCRSLPVSTHPSRSPILLPHHASPSPTSSLSFSLSSSKSLSLSNYFHISIYAMH